MKGNDTPKDTRPEIVRRWEKKTLPSPDPDPGAAYFVEDDIDDDVDLVSEKGKRFEARFIESVEAHRYPKSRPVANPAPYGYPAPMGEAAFHGPAGEIVRAASPWTEAADEALLIDLLVTFGILVGPGPVFPLGGSLQQPRLFSAVVGDTARGRKGAARSVVHALTRRADYKSMIGRNGPNGAIDWTAEHYLKGLTSGEGLIAAINKNKGDGRILIVENELGRLYTAAGRDGMTTSHILRDAWDENRLSVINKNSPIATSKAYVGMVASITQAELMQTLEQKGSVEALNGFGNRFLYIAARRSVKIPTTALPEKLINRTNADLRDRVRAARRVEAMHRNDRASKIWDDWYYDLAEPEGLYGAMTARLDVHAIRVSMIYALLDGSKTINSKHVEAAFEVIRYADDSARFIIGDSTGNPNADRILRALRLPDFAKKTPTTEMTRTDLFDLFAKKITKAELDAAISLLVRAGLVEEIEGEETGGRKSKTLRLRVVEEGQR